MTERSDEQIVELVRQTVARLAPLPDQAVRDDSRLVDDLGYHSLALLELAFTIEDELGLDPIDEQAARQVVTVGDLIGQVRLRLADRARTSG